MADVGTVALGVLGGFVSGLVTSLLATEYRIRRERRRTVEREVEQWHLETGRQVRLLREELRLVVAMYLLESSPVPAAERERVETRLDTLRAHHQTAPPEAHGSRTHWFLGVLTASYTTEPLLETFEAGDAGKAVQVSALARRIFDAAAGETDRLARGTVPDLSITERELLAESNLQAEFDVGFAEGE